MTGVIPVGGTLFWPFVRCPVANFLAVTGFSVCSLLLMGAVRKGFGEVV